MKANNYPYIGSLFKQRRHKKVLTLSRLQTLRWLKDESRMWHMNRFKLPQNFFQRLITRYGNNGAVFIDALNDLGFACNEQDFDSTFRHDWPTPTESTDNYAKAE